mgnify:CR=1 FL=1
MFKNFLHKKIHLQNCKWINFLLQSNKVPEYPPDAKHRGRGVLIYLVFFATLALSYLDGIEFSFLKDLLIKTDFAIIPVLIIVNYIYSRK